MNAPHRSTWRAPSDLALAEPEAAVGDTTYFCVVDAEGNAVSGIQSLNSGFGSGVTAGDTGILLNNRMAYWHLAPGHANRLAPGKRVRHTMNAPMVFKDGRLWAVRRHARRGQPGAGQSAGADRDDGSRTPIRRPRWRRRAGPRASRARAPTGRTRATAG